MFRGRIYINIIPFSSFPGYFIDYDAEIMPARYLQLIKHDKEEYTGDKSI